MPIGDADLLSIMRSAGRRRQLVAKRAFDLVFGSLALAVFLPLLGMAAVAVRTTTPGPALFRQTRLGRDGKPFTILKFRTLYTEDEDSSGLAQTPVADGRVTPVGRFLRMSKIDELPQLINLLRGDMSLVGPRPHVPGMTVCGVDYRLLVTGYDLRLLMPPGLTGWAQANGFHGAINDAEAARARVDLDLEYIRTFDVVFDLAIIWKTALATFARSSNDSFRRAPRSGVSP